MPTPDIDKLDATGGVQPKADQNTPQEGKFSKLMQEEPQQASTAAAPSPLQPVPATPPTPETIQAQMATVSSSLGDIKNQLHTKGLHFKQSDKYRLRSHLSTANQQIRSAAEHLGATTTPPPFSFGKQQSDRKILTSCQRWTKSDAISCKSASPSCQQ